MRKKQRGGYLRGNPHSRGGIKARIAGKEPVELEGKEYIMSAEATRRIGKDNLDEMNFGRKMPMGGRIQQPNMQSNMQNVQPNMQSAPNMNPNMPRQSKYQFRNQPLRNTSYMKHGGEVSISNDKAGIGEVHTTYVKDGYKAGK